MEVIASLSLNPQRYVRANESRMFTREVRQFVYRPPMGSLPFRLLYTVAEDGPDGPVFIIDLLHKSVLNRSLPRGISPPKGTYARGLMLALRYAAMATLTRKEARGIEIQNELTANQ